MVGLTSVGAVQMQGPRREARLGDAWISCRARAVAKQQSGSLAPTVGSGGGRRAGAQVNPPRAPSSAGHRAWKAAAGAQTQHPSPHVVYLSTIHTYVCMCLYLCRRPGRGVVSTCRGGCSPLARGPSGGHWASAQSAAAPRYIQVPASFTDTSPPPAMS